MKNTIFFDFFGVISSEVANAFFAKRFSENKAKELKDSIFVKADEGIYDEEKVYQLMSELTHENKEDIRKEWVDTVKINFELVNYIKELKKTHKVYLLSNAISSYLRNILSKYNLEECFDKIYISAEIHLIKPNANFFSYVTNDLGLNPKECIMIDDSQKNINGAESIGIKGIVYQNLEDLKSKIKEIEE